MHCPRNKAEQRTNCKLNEKLSLRAHKASLPIKVIIWHADRYPAHAI